MTRPPKMINCPVCNKEFKSHYRQDRGKYQIHCSRKCNGNAPKKVVTKKCVQCGTDYQTRKKNTKFCSRQCTQEAITVKYTDNELVYLAMINPGYGFRRFVTALYASRERAIPKCIEVFNKAKEMGMDPYDCLQDPSYMRKVDVFEYLENHLALPHHSGGTGDRTSLKKLKEKGSRGNRRLKDDSHIEFNWGVIEPREW